MSLHCWIDLPHSRAHSIASRMDCIKIWSFVFAQDFTINISCGSNTDSNYVIIAGNSQFPFTDFELLGGRGGG